MLKCIMIIMIALASGVNAKDVYVFIGQSNMMGASPVENLNPADLNSTSIFSWDGSGWNGSPAPTGSPNHGYSSGWHGPEIAAMQVIRDLIPTTTNHFIKFVWDGSPLHPELSVPGYTNQNWSENLYSALVGIVGAAVGAGDVVRAVFFMQGETDAIESTTRQASEYGSHLQTLKTRLHMDLGAGSFVVGRIRDNFKNSAVVRAAQEGVAGWVDTDDLGLRQDGIHFSTQGLLVLGRRLACSAAGLECVGDSTIFDPVTGDWFRLSPQGSWVRVIQGHGAQCNNQWLADVDGDGALDAVVYFGSVGNWYICTGKPDGSFNPYGFWWAGHGVGSDGQVMCDVDGDGALDAVVYFGSVGKFYVARASGGPAFMWMDLGPVAGEVLWLAIK